VKTVIFIARARGKAPEQRNQKSVRLLLLGGDLTGTIKTVCPKMLFGAVRFLLDEEGLLAKGIETEWPRP